MGAWETPLDAAIPVLLSRANYDRTRKRFYLRTGALRDETRLPKLAPPGAVVVKRTDGDFPAFDVATPGGAWEPGAWDGQLSFATFALDGASVGAPIEAPAAVALLNYRPALPFANYRPARPFVASDEWWYDTDFGRELAVTFMPPLVLGQYGWEPAEVTPIPLDNPALPPLVAVPLPHPYVVGMPEPLAILQLGSSSGGGTGALKPYGVYRSPVVVTGHGDRQAAKFYPTSPADAARGVPGFWMGYYFDAAHAEWYTQALEEVASTVARSSALSVLVQIVGTYLSVGAASPLIQAGLQAASQIAGESAGQAVAGIVTGGGAQGASNIVQASGIVPSTSEVVVSAAAPDQTNQVLTAAAQASVYLDALGSVQELWDLTFRELTIRAQRTAEAADALRLELAQREAKVHSETWFQVTQQTVNAVVAVVSGYGATGMGELVQAMMALGRLGISAATTALRFENALELARATRERLEREATDRRVQNFLRPTPVPTTPVTSPTGARLLWAWAAVLGAIGYVAAGVPGAAAGGLIGWIASRRRIRM